MAKRKRNKNLQVIKKKPPVTNDGFENLLTGMGTSKDPLTHTTFTRNRSLSQNQEFITSLYSQNWLAAAVVNVPVNDMTRNWIDIEIEDEAKEEQLEKALGKLKAKSKINQALKWAGAYGGAIIIMMVNDGRDMSEPLTVSAIRDKGLENLIVLDRWRVTVGPLDTNLLSKNFGYPEHYLVSRSGQKIHYSRVLRFDGEMPSIEEFERNGYWGNSTFEKTWSPISNSQTVSQEIAGMTKESNVDVYKIEGLNEMVALGPEGEAAVTKRLAVAHQLKSYINGIALDKNDDYEKKSNTFSGLGEIDDKFLLKVAGASQIPMSKLLGKTDAGLNGNGEGDLKNYYDNLSGRQEVEMNDPIQTLLDVAYVSEFGRVEQVAFEFNPLWQMTQEQISTIEANNATRDATYIDKGVVSVETVQKELASNGTYGSIEDDIQGQEELFGSGGDFGDEET